MDINETTVTTSENEQTGDVFVEKNNAPKKKAGIVAAVIISLAVVAIAVVLALVISNQYLDSMWDFTPVDSVSYNGYEIVNENGVYFLTKQGRRVSSNAYTMLESVNHQHYNGDEKKLLKDDARIYDYFIGRKSDEDTYFLINGEGKELAIEGEDLVYSGSYLPFIEFTDSVTGEKGLISLDNVDSDVSPVTDGSIELKMYDSLSRISASTESTLYFIVIAADNDPENSTPVYSYVGTQGKVLFTNRQSLATQDGIGNADDRKAEDWLFLCADGNMYNGAGALVYTDVVNIVSNSERTDAIIIHRAPKSEEATAFIPEELVVLTETAVFTVSDEQCDIDVRAFNDNVLVVASRTGSPYVVYDMTTGSQTYCDSYEYRYSFNHEEDLLVLKNGESYTYVDTKTAKTLVTSRYGNLIRNGIKGVFVGQNAKDLYFVAPGKTSVFMTLGRDESISEIFNDGEGVCAYLIENSAGEASKYSIYAPFANGAVRTASYDKIQILEAFGNGAPIAFATSYDSNSYDFIDIVTGTVVKSITPQTGEKMALTTVEFVDTYLLFNDFDDGVEFAVFKTVIKNLDGNVEKQSFYAFSRGSAKSDRLSVAELGDNVDRIIASDKSGYYGISASKYMIVNLSDWQSVIYVMNEAYELNRVCEIEHRASGVVRYSSSLEDVFIKATNPATGEIALFDLTGERVIGYCSDVQVSGDGEYFIVRHQDVYGAYKYDVRTGRVKQILDFEFGRIQYVGDGGFLVSETTSYGSYVYLYDGNSPAKASHITSTSTVMCYYTDVETGEIMRSVNYYYNFEGKYYVHRTVGRALVSTEPGMIYQTWDVAVEDTAPSVVVFRGTDGKVEQTRVIYPTQKSRNEFKMIDDSAWYDVGIKEFQRNKVSESEVKVMATHRHIINVYRAQTDVK